MKTLCIAIAIFAFINVSAAPARGQVQIAARTISEPANPEQDAAAPPTAEQTTPAAYYDDLIRQNPKAVSLYLQKAKAQKKNGAGPQAIIGTLEEALNQGGLNGTNKEVALAYNYLGDAYLQMENIYSAVLSYNKAHALAPRSKVLVDHIFSGEAKIGR